VAPVRAGGELIGSLWAAELGEPLGAEAEAELQRFGELAALHLIAHRSADDLRRRSRGVLVRELLDGRTPAEARRLKPPLALVAFEHEGWSGDPDRIVSIAGLYAESLHRDAICASVDDRVWAVVPCEDRDALDQLARRVVERARNALHADVRVAVGPPAATVAELPASRRAALQALAVLAAGRREGPVVHADDVRAHAALLELLDAAAGMEAFERGRLRALSPDLLVTLGAWLDHHGDVAAAAAAVGVHANTLRYRLRRIAETAGIDLGDPDERLVAALELRLLRREGQS
jgi:sugar diacid utilization regulator